MLTKGLKQRSVAAWWVAIGVRKHNSFATVSRKMRNRHTNSLTKGLVWRISIGRASNEQLQLLERLIQLKPARGHVSLDLSDPHRRFAQTRIDFAKLFFGWLAVAKCTVSRCI